MVQLTAPNTPGTVTVSATVDNQTSSATLAVTPVSPPSPPASNVLEALRLFVDSGFLGFFLPLTFLPPFDPLAANLKDQILSNPLTGTTVGKLIFLFGFDTGLTALQQLLQPPPPPPGNCGH